jgi:hypothetical protein
MTDWNYYYEWGDKLPIIKQWEDLRPVDDINTTSSITLLILVSLSSTLYTTEFIVQSTFHQQFIVGTHFSDQTIIKHVYHISILYGWKTMCNCDTSAALLCFVQCCLNNLEELTHSYNIIFLMHCYIQHLWCDMLRFSQLLLFSLSLQHSHIHKA